VLGRSAQIRGLPAGVQETVTVVGRSTDVPGDPARLVVVVVTPAVSIALPATSSATTTLIVTGTVSPVLAGRRVTLYLQAPNGWRGLAAVTADSAGRYRLSVKPARGNYKLRTGVPAAVGYAAAVSRTVLIHRT
jgi:hypothetical protein